MIKTRIIWTSSDIRTFESTKEALANATELGHPVSDSKFYHASDASNTGMRAVLQQNENYTPGLLGLFSQIFNKAQLYYRIYDCWKAGRL